MRIGALAVSLAVCVGIAHAAHDRGNRPTRLAAAPPTAAKDDASAGRTALRLAGCNGHCAWVQTPGPFLSGVAVGPEALYIARAGHDIVDGNGRATEEQQAEIVALALADGRVMWRVPLGHTEPATPPAMCGTDVIAVSVRRSGRGSEVVAVSTASRRVLWRRGYARSDEWTPAFLGAGMLVLPVAGMSAGGRLDALRVADGRRVWSRPVSSIAPYDEPPASSTGRLYYTDGQGDIVCRDVRDGRPVWRVRARAACAPICAGPTVVAVDRRAKLVVLDTASGRRLRSIPLGVKPLALAVGPGNVAYASTGRDLRAVDIATGRLLWSRADGGREDLVASADGRLVASGPGGVSLFDSRNGHRIWRLPIRGTPLRPAIGPDHRIYIATFEGAVMAIE